MVIVPVEEAALLPAVDRVVGGVEVEDRVRRRLGMGGDELVDEGAADAGQGLAVDAVLQAAKGRRRGEGRLRLGDHPGGHLQRGVGPQVLMIVEVLVSQGEGDDPLGEHGLLIVDEEGGVTRVGDRGVEGVEEAEAIGGLTQEQGA
jgi:hypothetical protein